MRDEAIGSWVDVETLLKTRPPGTLLKVPRSWLDHPRAHGMRNGFSVPSGQFADYVKRLDETTSLEVAAYRGHYMARLHVVDLRRSPQRHAAQAMSGVVLGAVLGGVLGRTEHALAAGAAVGGVLWAALRR